MGHSFDLNRLTYYYAQRLCMSYYACIEKVSLLCIAGQNGCYIRRYKQNFIKHNNKYMIMRLWYLSHMRFDNLKVCMRNYLVVLDACTMASAFFYVPTLCLRADNALASLCRSPSHARRQRLP